MALSFYIFRTQVTEIDAIFVKLKFSRVGILKKCFKETKDERIIDVRCY